MHKSLLALASGTALVAGGLIVANTADAHAPSVTAELSTADGSAIGSVKFKEHDGHTEVRVHLSSTPGLNTFHGFHIHANNDPSNGDGCVADPSAASSTWFVSADGHYNPTTETHPLHLGDLPVAYVNADGSVQTRFRIDTIEPGDLDGKVVILHAGPDNFANIPLGTGPTQYTANSDSATAATARTGNAGDRVACGVITSD